MPRQYLRRILQFRKTSKALTKGTTLHFAPENGFYLLVRQYNDETVLLALNKNEGSVKMETSRFAELELAGKDLENLFTGEVISWDAEIVLQNPGAYIWMVK